MLNRSLTTARPIASRLAELLHGATPKSRDVPAASSAGYTAAVMVDFPLPSRYGSLVELLDDAATRWPSDRDMYSLRTDDGIAMAWSGAEMRERSLLAAWRLRAIGLEAGDRLLTWSPSTPRLPAIYWAAMRAGVIIVPLDLRMTLRW